MPNMSKVVIFRDKGGEWRFRVVAANGEFLVQRESYRDPPDARRGAIDAVLNFVGAVIHGNIEQESS